MGHVSDGMFWHSMGQFSIMFWCLVGWVSDDICSDIQWFTSVMIRSGFPLFTQVMIRCGIPWVMSVLCSDIPWVTSVMMRMVFPRNGTKAEKDKTERATYIKEI